MKGIYLICAVFSMLLAVFYRKLGRFRLDKIWLAVGKVTDGQVIFPLPIPNGLPRRNAEQLFA